MSESSRAPGRRPPRDRYALVALHAFVVVTVAVWVRGLDVAVGIAAAASALTPAVAAARARRWVIAGAFVALAAAIGWSVAQDARDPIRAGAFTPMATGDTARHLERAMADAIRDAQIKLTNAAAVVAGGVSAASALPSLKSDVGIIAFSADSAADWAGRSVVPADRLWERSGVVVTPLYIVQYATALHGARRAVAMSVVSATPPADRLAQSLASVIGAGGAARFTIAVSPSRPSPGATVDVGGAHLVIAATSRDPEAFAAASEQDSRARAAALLLLATLISLATLWRRAEGVPDRLAAAAIPLAALAIAPLNALSNITVLFDPANYYVASGGPFTASIGALGLTAALVLFAVMAVVRARARPARRSGAVFAVVGVAVVAPFLLRQLSAGVSLPPSGATTSLWLGWEVALFLTATSFLAAGVSAGQRALGGWRGLPLWAATLVAATAALLGPVLIESSARWPDWYPVLWVVAIVALALARRSRLMVFASAFVAACGATVLLWGATLRERVALATGDVESLATVDSSVYTLLQRFAADIEKGPEPRSREQMLVRYAASDLASVDYPVTLANWPYGTAPTQLQLGGARYDEVLPIVNSARAVQDPQLRTLTPNPAASLALAVPYPSGDVFSVVVGAPSRLTESQASTELLGLSGHDGPSPYQLNQANPTTPNDSARTSWSRRGDHLHSEWRMPSGKGKTVRVVADVAFDPYGTLISHGMLIVMIDLAIVLFLLGGDLLASGVLARWARLRGGRWRRSYRLKLSLALFAFFVVPAMAFALWSYRRLQDDDRAARQLLLREALRFADADTTRSSAGGPAVANLPPDSHYFLYRRGQLVGASDPLLLALAPVGQWLDPAVNRVLATGDQIVATATTAIGDRDMLFGYKALATDLVIGIAGRRDDIAIDKRRGDIGVLVILATVLGALAALALSGAAARNLARPIGTLRDAALAVAGGSRTPLNARDAPSEFVPVFTAFDRMARDLAESEAQLARAERVFAWGEVARQVAHEIKNPLTPIRLGMQHLLRAWRDRSPSFGTILEDNSARVLREIDHLDATARSFSRFGTTPDAPALVGAIDVAAAVRDIVSFEALGAEALAWTATGVDAPIWARARGHEFREVLLNLCENARVAGSRSVELRLHASNGRVTLNVVDDGEGIPERLHTRVFEPHFSTSTSGSGLGLAISRRLVESWGGRIELDSEPGTGTTLRLVLVPAEPPKI